MVSSGALLPSCTAKPSETTALVGELVSCQSNDTCHPGLVTFPGTERDLAAMTIECAYPAESTSVYSLTRVETVADKGQLHDTPPVRLRTAAAAEDQSFHVTFADELSEYCVRVVTQSLATGELTTSPELCVPRVDLPATGSPLKTALSRCVAPPVEETSDGCTVGARRPAGQMGALVLAIAALTWWRRAARSPPARRTARRRCTGRCRREA
jgi:hypothetical protein